MPLNHFYEDNLVKTHNSAAVTMVSLYKEAIKIMQEGNFTLKSCNSNGEVVRTQMIEDENYVDHSLTHEKVLSYLYFLQSDESQLSEIPSSVTATTKRSVLSQIPTCLTPCPFVCL